MDAIAADLAGQWWWTAFGSAGALLFYGRFYLQWIVSEVQKRSVIPIAFWYVSSIGSVILLVYGIHIQSPMGTLSQSVNMVIYSRNLVHIWRERRGPSQRRDKAIHAVVALIVLAALYFTARTWLNEYAVTRTVTAEEARQTWFWLAVGLVGQGMFALRFLIQWAVTEIKRRSVFPIAFWYISIVAASLLAISFAQRREWVYAVGLVATIFIYGRNLWFIHRNPEAPVVDAEA